MVKSRELREEEDRFFRSRNLQNFFILSGSFPWPVVAHTNTTSLSLTKFSY